ncbi:MAG: hypothetical protein MOGMAGMI_00017 [Candidatus Omnitrophica bacterium]|nr:hypothetical protein [Candidatus Omnitrophota bacterium]
MTGPSSPKTLTAVWDVRRAPLTPGRALLLLQEIALARSGGAYRGARIVWTGQPPAPEVLSYAACVDEVRCALPGTATAPDEVTLESLRGAVPGADSESTLFIQRLCGDRPSPVLVPRAEYAHRAADRLRRLRRRSGRKRVLTLHLKSDPGAAEGNADGAEWAAFLERARESGGAALLAVGNELPVEVRSLRDLEWTRGASLVEDLALIAGSDAFMGMASSLCQAALFGDKPYAVFKAPGHHAAKMSAELKGPYGFTFARPTQRFLMEPDAREALWREWTRIQEVWG